MSLEKVSLNNPDQLELLRDTYLTLDRDPAKLDEASKGVEWIEIGFQCDDPTTDFRGTGQLGLLNLHYFVKQDPQNAIKLLDEANLTEQHYFFACAGINITHKLMFMISEDKVRIHNFDSCNDKEEALHRFNLLYSKFFEDFHRYWLSSSLKSSIMNFNVVLSDFCEKYKQNRV